MGRTGKRGNGNATSISTASSSNVVAVGNDMKDWFQKTTLALAAKALDNKNGLSSAGESRGGEMVTDKASKKALVEAKERSAQLSTKSDKTGVSFAGGAFQANYFTSKFQRRGCLLYEIMCDLNCELPKGAVEVASFGGGPGTDVAGLAWFQKQRHPDSHFICTMYDFEKSFKKFVKLLQDAFSEVGDIQIEFHPCDVTRSLQDGFNRKVAAGTIDLAIFFYVCHETSVASKKRQGQFYKDLSCVLKRGCVVVIADVNGRSKPDLELVCAHLSQGREVLRLEPKKPHNAEVVAFRYI